MAADNNIRIMLHLIGLACPEVRRGEVFAICVGVMVTLDEIALSAGVCSVNKLVTVATNVHRLGITHKAVMALEWLI